MSYLSAEAEVHFVGLCLSFTWENLPGGGKLFDKRLEFAAGVVLKSGYFQELCPSFIFGKPAGEREAPRQES